jgi:hypothetical protein
MSPHLKQHREKKTRTPLPREVNSQQIIKQGEQTQRDNEREIKKKKTNEATRETKRSNQYRSSPCSTRRKEEKKI